MTENKQRCLGIAQEIEKIAEGNCYTCPHCGEVIELSDEQYNEDVATYTCPECGEEFDENEMEAFTLWDYFADVLDIEYKVGADKQYRGVRLLVAFGGPNIYIDTNSRLVQLYWWDEYAECPILDGCDEIDGIFEELYNS